MRRFMLMGACLALLMACGGDDDGSTGGGGSSTTSGGSGGMGGQGGGGGLTCPDLDNVDCTAACANEATVVMEGTCINEAVADCMSACESLGSPGPIHWGCLSLYDTCDGFSACIAPMPEGCR